MSNNVGFSSLSEKVIRKDYDKALRQSILNDPTLIDAEKRRMLNKLPVPPPQKKKGGRRSKRRTSKKQEKMSKKKRKYNKKQ